MKDLNIINEEFIKRIADSKTILLNGKHYYMQGRIKEFKISKNNITAKVLGSLLYDVNINLSNDVFDIDCSCPYPGVGCKHVAAVLYKYLKENKTMQKNKVSKNKKSIIDVIDFNNLVSNTNEDKLLEAFHIIKNKQMLRINKKDNKEIIVNLIYNNFRYKIKVLYDKDYYKDNIFTECSCNYNSYYFKCAHAIAALLFIIKTNKPEGIPEDYEANLINEKNRRIYNSFVNSLNLNKEKINIKRLNFNLIFNFSEKNKGISINIQKAALLSNGRLGKPTNTNKYFIKNNYDKFSENEIKILDLFFSALNNDFDYETTKSKFETSSDLNLFYLLKDHYQNCPENFKGVKIIKEKILASISVQNNIDNPSFFNIVVSANVNDSNIDLADSKKILIANKSLWIFSGGEKRYLFEIETSQPKILKKIIDYSDLNMTPDILKDFIENYYILLSNIGKVSLPQNLEINEMQDIAPTPRIYLSELNDKLAIDLILLYGKKETSYFNKFDLIFKNEENKFYKIIRNIELEERYKNMLLENANIFNDKFYPKIDSISWMFEKTPPLISSGFEIFGRENLIKHKIRKEHPNLDIKISSNIDWFDLNGEVNYGNQKVPLDVFFNSLKNNESYIKLNDGTIGVIPKKWLSRLSGVVGFLTKEKKENSFKASNTQIQIIESLLDISSSKEIDKKYMEISKKFKKFKEIKDIELPKGLNGELREYQKAGYNWLHFLKEFEFGGCLADDMGLGKTVQILSLLLFEKEQGNTNKSLIVVPTSLMFNWAAEIKKFTPSLNYYTHHGINRIKDYSKIDANIDLIITTYGTLRNDVELFKGKDFNYIILDESQKIKNPLSQSTKSIYSLKSKYRMVLTGTPIENNYLELWSQFAFLNPGLLGNMDFFRNNFMSNMALKDNNKSLSLRNTINPFILMRKKESVAKDLPEKQITTLYCEMNKDHKIFYESWKEKYKKEIIEAVEKEGFVKSRFKILQGLIKMRQISNHPLLVDQSYIGESTKFNLAVKQIEEIVSEGHKVLVFSSFVKMLTIFKDYFIKNNINFSYLDGSTIKRKEVVEDFQNNKDKNIFLISLKAGGLGLNLTSADYVFIIDPWWNPAAEMQAIDRAHRIGQDKKVFVYKIITKDTVEEKILELQNTKMDLVKKVIPGDEGIFKSLNKDDLVNLFK